jgi:zinc finger CCCH domain-containing protein 13
VSRSRREPSPSRRDRDAKERDRSRRRDDRDESRRDRDDYFRRDWEDRDRDDGYRDRDRYDYSRRDLDRDLEDDARRWRDDGKRDERIAARRERERDRDRWDRWEPSHERERLDDRDGRTKRTARDRRNGPGLDDTKDKEDRKEREKEKEPAWMETYVPSTPGGGILGGRSADGELDGIQAWKKGLKEKEKKEKEKEKEAEQSSESANQPVTSISETTTNESASTAVAENPMDEIQLFKLIMKREAAKKDSDSVQESPVTPIGPAPPAIGRMSPAKLKGSAISAPGGQFHSFRSYSIDQGISLSASSSFASTAIPASESSTISVSSVAASPSVAPDGSKLLSLLTQASTEVHPSQTSKFSTPTVPPPDDLPPTVSRMFPTPPGLSPSMSQNSERQAVDVPAPSYPNSPFDPPAGSRLLAFGARATPSNAQVPKVPAESGGMPFNNAVTGGLSGPAQRLAGVNAMTGLAGPGIQQGSEMAFNVESEPQLIHNARATPSERSTRSFSPFGQPHQSPFGLQDAQDTMRLPQVEALRRIVAPPAERSMGLGPDNAGFLELGGGQAGLGAGNFDIGSNAVGAAPSVAKGSRFAKFFDKNREPQAAISNARKPSSGNGFIAPSPLQAQGRDVMALNGMMNSPAENRAMEDLFAMLQSSAQVRLICFY